MIESGMSHPVAFAFGGVFALLVLASLICWRLMSKHPDRDYNELYERIRTWWIICTLFGGCVFLGEKAVVIFLGFVSFLALKEYFSLVPTRRADRRILFWAYIAIPVQYYFAYIGWYGMFIIFIPVYVFLFLPFRALLIGETSGFVRSMGSVHWGLMIFVFGISHLAALVTLENNSGTLDGIGALVFLLFLGQFNDVAQYVFGKSFGRHKIIPKISPGKTWEGFLGGVATTGTLAALLGPSFTPFSSLTAAIAGVVISGVGFIGDVTISALKRDIGVKDSSQFLPGHGGVMDRIDSLSYAAPLFFHFIRYFGQ